MYLTSAKYRVIISHVAHGDGYLSQPEKNIKKIEKTFKKGIDKRDWMWYNNKVAARAVAGMILEN